MGTLLWGIMFIVAGASGQFVLRGTNSPAALMVVGGIMVVWGMVGMATKKGRTEKIEEETSARGRNAVSASQVLSAPCRVMVAREKKIVGAANRYEMFLNGSPIGTLKNGTTLGAQTELETNILTSPQLARDFSFQAVPGGVVRLKLLGFSKDGIPFRVEAVEPMRSPAAPQPAHPAVPAAGIAGAPAARPDQAFPPQVPAQTPPPVAVQAPPTPAPVQAATTLPLQAATTPVAVQAATTPVPVQAVLPQSGQGTPPAAYPPGQPAVG